MRTLADISRAIEEGRTCTAHFRRGGGLNFASGQWQDLSVMTGSPPPQYYASTPLEAAVINSTRYGLPVQRVSPAKQIVTGITMIPAHAGMQGAFKLLDYVMYYPFIDLADTAEQAMSNPIDLPRYSTGAGLKVLAVCQGATDAIAGSFSFVYDNQDGAERTSPVQTIRAATTNYGHLLMNERNPYCTLLGSDTGVRRIKSVTVTVAPGGLMCLVLVRELASFQTAELSAPTEIQFPINGPPPVVEDGAMLSFLLYPLSTTSNNGFCAGWVNTAFGEGA